MNSRSMKLVAITFMGLSAGLAINLFTLQPTASGRLAGRSGDRGAQKAAQAQALTLAIEPAKGAASGSESRGMADPRPNGGDKSRIATAAVQLPAEPSPAGDGPETIRAVQRELQARGYEAGTADGVPGLITRAAVLAYEYDHGLPMTGEPSERLLKKILLGESQPAATPGSAGIERSAQAEQVIRTVQQSLANAGYAVGKSDGRLGEETVRAIREFETDQGLPETGRISGQLVARLARLAGQGRLSTAR
jgi:peptidoglycan hydrolase-like protein with peptidoglycan-binding domain